MMNVETEKLTPKGKMESYLAPERRLKPSSAALSLSISLSLSLSQTHTHVKARLNSISFSLTHKLIQMPIGLLPHAALT